MSSQHTVKQGETLSSIAAQVYGDANEWPRISNANATTSDSPPVGTVLNIPDIPAEAELRTQFAADALTGESADELTILVAGVPIQPMNARIVRAVDTGADGWTAQIPWTAGRNPAVEAVTKPYQYNPASAYIGNDLTVNGLLYTVAPLLNNQGRIKNLAGWSYTADAVDSTLKPPYERNNITLQQLADELVAPLGIQAVFDTEPGAAFKRATASPSDTIFDFLAGLATQRGIIVSSTPNGDLLFTKSGTVNVGTLQEGTPGVMISGAEFDGRLRFNAYRAIGQSPGANAKAAIAVDTGVPRTRFFTFQADDTTTGDIQHAANWRRTKALAEALTITIPVTGWIAPNGEKWLENTLVTVISETLFLPDGYELLIRSVEYILGGDGKTTLLGLVPPEVYAGEEITDPWA